MTKKKLNKNTNSNLSVVKPIFEKPAKNATNFSRSNTGIKGLQNLGNTCYFNSMLQMLLNSPFFLNQLKAYCSKERTIVARSSDKEYEIVLKTTDVGVVEKELLSIWESEKENISPSSLRSALLQHKDFKAHFSGFNEQDSHEVFLMVLNIIKESQVKRIRGAVLDFFNARKLSSPIDDDTKKKIKEISAAIEKQTLVNNIFGMVIGSNLKCQNCGELRMRFDEVFHLTPVFGTKNEFEAGTSDCKGDSEVVILKPKNQPIVNEKMSKHQMKRQKRIEKKTARNKKSIQRNVECSPEETYADNPVATNGNDTEELISEANIDTMDERQCEDEDNAVNSIVIVGNGDDDHVTLESMANQKPMSSECSSSDGSMIARMNDSSRGSMTSSIEDVICHQLIRDLSMEERNDDDNDQLKIANNKEDREENGYGDSLDDNSCRDMMDEDSDVDKMSSAGNIVRANVDHVARIDVCDDSQSTERMEEEDEEGCVDAKEEEEGTGGQEEEKSYDGDDDDDDDAVIVDSRTTDVNQAFLQSAFSAALETHQDRLTNRFSQSKIAFEPETDLDRALSRLTVPMFLENIVCETCSSPKQKIQTDHFKTDVLCHLPQILPFYISRFKQCAARNRTKNTQVYSYPTILNLSSQCSQYANFTGDSSPVLYRLFGIIEHIGGRINTGHYVSYVCHSAKNNSRRSAPDSDEPPRPPPSSLYPTNILSELSVKHEQHRFSDFHWPDDGQSQSIEATNDIVTEYQWFRISDSHVESVSKDSVMRVQAFMLFYYRIQ